MNRSRSGRSVGTVLVVEDDLAVLDAIAEILEQDGYRVLRAANGCEALRRIRAERTIDAVLLDLNMPVMDGWQFRLEQRRDPNLATIPLVAFSADSSSRAQAVDADAFLAKPVDGQVLLRTVEQVIRAGRARRQDAEQMAHTERLTQLGHLAAAVAHEINNPLSWVVGNLRIVADRLEQPERLQARLEDTAAAVREALEGALRIQAIVSEIRVFTRKVEDEATTVDLIETFENLLRLMDRQLSSRAKVVREFEGPLYVHAPAGRLRQVLVNLLANAVDALPDRPREQNQIRVSARRDGGGRVRIEVADNGTGIPEEMLPRIFEPFFTTKAPGVGTGLGLFVCRALVTGMGGELRVASACGVGTRFWFRVAEAERKEQVVPRPFRIVSPPMTVLVVDDEAAVLAALQRQLQGHQVLCAASAEEALSIVRDRPDVDAILCDLYMPGMSGLALYEELGRQDRGLQARMAFMTAGIVDEEMLQFARSRADRVIQKPIDGAEISTLLARLGSVGTGMRTASGVR